MLYDLLWLQPQKSFPPSSEQARLQRYASNLKIFKGDQWELEDEYRPYFNRISSTVSNLDAAISFPILLNYQKLITTKIADLVCGDSPVLTGSDSKTNDTIDEIIDDCSFLTKLYSTVIDISRYGDAVWRVYKKNGKNTFTLWNPSQWFPIVSQDGTNTIEKHVLCWTVNRGTDEMPDWSLHAQIHSVGYYEYRVFELDHKNGQIGNQISSSRSSTGLAYNAVMSLREFDTSDTVYGMDDYLAIDSVLAELMVRLAQISSILDKHADPAMTGPVSMLKQDPITGRYRLEVGSFFGISPGEVPPQYLTWEGQLTAAFKQVELLLDQLYILTEIGSSMIGADKGGQAISAVAMRFKMAGPLGKARRLTNNLTYATRLLISLLSQIGYIPLKINEVSIEWADGLPEDPRENAEIVKLLSGRQSIMPLELAIQEYFGRSNAEALRWIELIQEEDELFNPEGEDDDPNKAGPQDGTGVNPREKGSDTGLRGFKNPKNK